MQIIRGIEQGSEEWHNLRSGTITGSMFSAVLSKGAGKTRKAYMYSLAAEVLTGEVADSFSNEYMEWGTKTEPQARAMYKLRTGSSLESVAFIKGVEGVGVSPDDLVNENGLLEIKCPKTTTQIETYMSGKMPTKHKAQVQGQLWVSEREWCDFVSFDPRINGVASWLCVRVERDEEYINTLKSEVARFKAELDELVNKLKG